MVVSAFGKLSAAPPLWDPIGSLGISSYTKGQEARGPTSQKAMATPANLGWGILATGNISEKFTRDILTDPATRNVFDVSHTLVAVASSTSLQKAVSFIEAFSPELAASKFQKGPVKPYGSYAELLEDSNVDIVYIGSPHSDHYKTCLMALRADKHVLCEKAFTLNAPQSAHLCTLARERKRFLLEGQWTRFFPELLSLQAQLNSSDSPIGKIHRMFSEFSIAAPRKASYRLYDPKQGGGALLDMGVYTILWAFLVFYRHPQNALAPPDVAASVVKTPLTGVDEQDVVILKWEKLGVQCTCSTSMVDRSVEPFSIVLYGEKGNLFVPWMISRPVSYTIQLHGQPAVKHDLNTPGRGMFWMADACARSIARGELESEVLPHAESIEIMKVMDKVREIGGVHYGDLEDLE